MYLFAIVYQETSDITGVVEFYNRQKYDKKLIITGYHVPEHRLVISGKKEIVDESISKFNKVGIYPIFVYGDDVSSTFKNIYLAFADLGFYNIKTMLPHIYSIYADAHNLYSCLLRGLDNLGSRGKVKITCSSDYTTVLPDTSELKDMVTERYVSQQDFTERYVSQQDFTECIVVLGNSQRSVLKKRLDTAIDRVNSRRENGLGTFLIFSGSFGEAEEMEKLALERNIPEKFYVLENKSVNTNQNIAFSKTLLDRIKTSQMTVVFCSDFYHCPRILLSALTIFVNSTHKLRLLGCDGGRAMNEDIFIRKTMMGMIKHLS